jgi:orotidine-5'-phosphate decarboxylase
MTAVGTQQSEHGATGAGRFGARLSAAFDRYGQLCVGIDPHDYLLDAWGLERSAAGAREFGLRVVAAASGLVGVVKPQVAFFELYGSAGFRALEDVLAEARSAGLMVIADAKRGDIGSSVEAYGRAWLAPGSPLEADAVTLAAYTGTASLESVFAFAEANGKGAFVLSATSNPESRAGQTAVVAEGNARGGTVAALVADEVSAWNIHRSAPEASVSGVSLGSIGVVLGATKDLIDYGIDPQRYAATTTAGSALPVLAPGFGHQGATFGDVRRVFGALAASTVVSASRSVLQAGPTAIREGIAHQAGQLREALR